MENTIYKHFKECMSEFKYEIISGIPYKYIIDYFCEITSKNDNQSIFYSMDWKVEVVPEENRVLRKIYIPATRVIFRGNQKACEKAIKDFRMKFLSAGG